MNLENFHFLQNNENQFKLVVSKVYKTEATKAYKLIFKICYYVYCSVKYSTMQVIRYNAEMLEIVQK